MNKDDQVSLGVHRARCQSCSHLFEAFRLSVFLHRERLYFAADGTAFVYANFLSDPVVAEVRTLLAELGESLADDSRLHPALLAASDPLEGKPLDPERTTPACPKCGSSEVTVEPQRFRSDHYDVPVLAHTAWAKLSPEEKRNTLRAAMRRTG